MPVISSEDENQPHIHPLTLENIADWDFHKKGNIYIRTKDRKEYGGHAFEFYLKPDGKTIHLFRDNYLGGGWYDIPIDEIEGVRQF